MLGSSQISDLLTSRSSIPQLTRIKSRTFCYRWVKLFLSKYDIKILRRWWNDHHSEKTGLSVIDESRLTLPPVTLLRTNLRWCSGNLRWCLENLRWYSGRGRNDHQQKRRQTIPNFHSLNKKLVNWQLSNEFALWWFVELLHKSKILD